MTRVRLPLPLRRYAGEEPAVEVSGRTVGECLALLEALYPDVASRLRDEDGDLSSAVNLYVNGEDVRHRDGLDTSVSDEDEVTLVVAIAGGV